MHALRQARLEAGLTLRDVGERLGVDRRLIGQWETGSRHPRPQTLERIADALEVSVDELLARHGHLIGSDRAILLEHPIAALRALAIAGDLARSGVEEDRHLDACAGGRMVWVLDPEPRRIMIFTLPNHIQILESDATLDAGEVLEGFRCPVSLFFEWVYWPSIWSHPRRLIDLTRISISRVNRRSVCPASPR